MDDLDQQSAGEASEALDGQVALFDFDGTLTRASTVSPLFLRTLPSSGRYFKALRLCKPAFAYWRGSVAFSDVMRATSDALIAGMDRRELERHAEAIASKLDQGGLWPESVARLRSHVARGDQVAIVTGGYEFVAKAWLARHKLTAVQVFSSTLAWSDEGRAGAVVDICVSQGKMAATTWALSTGKRVVSYGNSSGDHEMLRASHEAWWVDKKGRLSLFAK